MTCGLTPGRNEAYYHLDSIEGEWNRGRVENPNLGYKLRHKEGYFPVPPADQLMNIRNEMMQTMIDCGMDVEAQHHEVATAGQCEIDLRFQNLVKMADQMCMYKYIIKNVAKRHNRRSRSCPSHSTATTAQACTRTSRCGRGASPCSPAAVTPD